MHPILFEIGSHEIHFYSVVYPFAVLLGVILAAVRAGKEGFDEIRMYRMFIFVLFGLIVGSHLLRVLVSLDRYIAEPRRLLSIYSGGVFYGGYLGAIAGGWLYLRRSKHPNLPVLDICSTYMGLGLAIHRSLGCFMAGCCFGRPTDMPWGVTFPPGSKPAAEYGCVALHPTQLYEAVLGIVIFLALVYWRRKRVVYGEQSVLSLYLYSIGRFVIEFFRGDPVRGYWGPLSTSQWISLGLLIVAVILTFALRRRRRLLRAGRLDPKGVSEPHDFVPLGAG